MSKAQTVDVPIQVIQRLQGVLAELERIASPYQASFLARMYRARASDLEGKGKSLAEVKRRFLKTS
jgi:hypothetical protein